MSPISVTMLIYPTVISELSSRLKPELKKSEVLKSELQETKTTSE